MTPAEHYAESERILDLVEEERDPNNLWIAPNLAAAQVHATLATVDPMVLAAHADAVARVEELDEQRTREATPDELRSVHHLAVTEWRDIHGDDLIAAIGKRFELDGPTAEKWLIGAASFGPGVGR